MDGGGPVGAGGAAGVGRLRADTSAAERVVTDVGGVSLVGHLHHPPGDRGPGRRPAVVVGGALTTVKEQMAGTYARALADRGYLALALDYRHYGESGGLPRQYEHPETKARDVSAGLDLLAGRPDVDPDRLGVVGVCASGGTVLHAAAADHRVRAVACVAGHLTGPEVVEGLYGGAEGVARRLAASRAAAQRFASDGTTELVLAYSDVDPSASHVGPFPYYVDVRRGGGVPHWRNAFAVMSWGPWLAFDAVATAAGVSAPTLFVHTDDCALPEQVRRASDAVAGPVSVHWTAGDHFEFYDGPRHVVEAVDAVEAHLVEHLA